MDILRYSSFSKEDIGGNPAGVVLVDNFPDSTAMQACAADVGYSETAFAMPVTDGWRVRYFSPKSEVPFCGHATIALGAALAQHDTPGNHTLILNDTNISVECHPEGDLFYSALQSPTTKSHSLSDKDLSDCLKLFNYDKDALDANIKPAHINAGADHFLIPLADHQSLSSLNYDLDLGRKFMEKHGLITVMFITKETDQLFSARNAFASGGVFEDPATGAAAAAFSGYLRDINWPHGNKLMIKQGYDMGMPSHIFASIPSEIGSSVEISGTVRKITTT